MLSRHVPWLVVSSSLYTPCQLCKSGISSATATAIDVLRSDARQWRRKKAPMVQTETKVISARRVQEWESACDETMCRNQLEEYDGLGHNKGYSCWAPLVSALARTADAKQVEPANTTATNQAPSSQSLLSIEDREAKAAATNTTNLFSLFSAEPNSVAVNTSFPPSDDKRPSANLDKQTSAALPVKNDDEDRGSSNKTNITRPSDISDIAACADGFGAILVKDAPTMVHRNVSYIWYTCCIYATLTLPSNDESANGVLAESLPQRQCSDSVCTSDEGKCWGDTVMGPMSCDVKTEFRYPRKTGAEESAWGFWISQFLCCTSPGADGSPFLENALLLELVRVCLSPVTLAACLLVICGVLSSEETRYNSYNLYLVFLAVPDALYSAFNVVAGAHALNGIHTQAFLVWGFYVFYTAANMGMNAVIALQIYRLLVNSNQRRKTNPPTVRSACQQAAAVFVWSVIVGTFVGVMYHPSLVISVGAVQAVWISSIFLATAPPCACLGYVCTRVCCGKLLPKSGRTRTLSLYYLRVVLVFIVFWIPSTAISAVSASGSWITSKKLENVIIMLLLLMLQGILSSAVALSKPDIKKATCDFILCGCISNCGTGSEVAGVSSFRRFRQSLTNFSLSLNSPASTYRTSTNASDGTGLAEATATAAAIDIAAAEHAEGTTQSSRVLHSQVSPENFSKKT